VCGRGLQVESEAAEASIGCEAEWRGLRGAPSGTTIPLLEVCEPESHIRSEPSVSVDTGALEGEVQPAVERIASRSAVRNGVRCGVGMRAPRGAATRLLRLDAAVVMVLQVQHTSHEGTCTRQYCSCELQLTNKRCEEREADSRFGLDSSEQSAELLEAGWCAGQSLCDRVNLDAEEGQLLCWSFGLVRIDDQAKIGECLLSDSECYFHGRVSQADEEEVIEVADELGDC
jgi:hypothetical protein